MNNIESKYLNLLIDVLKNGNERMDRTGVGTLSLFGKQLKCSLKEGFPAITTKKLFWKPMVAELLWFIEGSRDERRLAKIQYGDEYSDDKKTIWTANAHSKYWEPHAKFYGDVGRIYGVQWRYWNVLSDDGTISYVDQLANLIDTLEHNPNDRRMILSAYNVGELKQMSLPPCHMFSQFYCNNDELSCQVYIRSNDLFLGLPFNLASYALLTHMIAQVTGKIAAELIITIGDAHIYKNHLNQVKEQLTRKPYDLPQLNINPAITNIDDFKMDDLTLINYKCHPTIKAPMAV